MMPLEDIKKKKAKRLIVDLFPEQSCTLVDESNIIHHLEYLEVIYLVFDEHVQIRAHLISKKENYHMNGNIVLPAIIY